MPSHTFIVCMLRCVQGGCSYFTIGFIAIHQLVVPFLAKIFIIPFVSRVDVFLSDFDIVFDNCDGHHLIKGWLARKANERGYYVIAKKRG